MVVGRINSDEQFRNSAAAFSEMKKLEAVTKTRLQLNGKNPEQAESSQHTVSTQDETLLKTIVENTRTMEASMRDYLGSLQDDDRKRTLTDVQEASDAKASNAEALIQTLTTPDKLRAQIDVLQKNRMEIGDQLKNKTTSGIINPADPAYQALVLNTQQLNTINRAVQTLKTSTLSPQENSRLVQALDQFDGSPTSLQNLTEISNGIMGKNGRDPFAVVERVNAALNQTKADPKTAASEQQLLRSYQVATGQRGNLLIEAPKVKEEITLGGDDKFVGSGIKLDGSRILDKQELNKNHWRVIYKDKDGKAQKGKAVEYKQHYEKDPTGRTVMTTYAQPMIQDKKGNWIPDPDPQHSIKAYTVKAGKDGRESGLALSTANAADWKNPHIRQISQNALAAQDRDKTVNKAVTGIKVEALGSSTKIEPKDKPLPMTHGVTGYKWVGWDKGLIQLTYDEKSFEEQRKENAKVAQPTTSTSSSSSSTGAISYLGADKQKAEAAQTQKSNVKEPSEEIKALAKNAPKGRGGTPEQKKAQDAVYQWERSQTA